MYVAHGSYPVLRRPIMCTSSIKIAYQTAYNHLSSNKPQVIPKLMQVTVVAQLLFFHCIVQCGLNQVHESTQVNVILHGSLTFFIEEVRGSC
jgi:hypothetical protein